MINSVYDYYLSTYGRQVTSRHDSHDKKELRETYNNIVKINKSSPVYKIDTSANAQKLAIDIKESARALMDTLEDISDVTDGTLSLSNVAVSDNPNLVTAKYVGNGEDPEPLTFKVEQLAEPQVNTGNFLPPTARNLFAGAYSFDVESAGVTYQIDFSVESNDTNQSVQNKLGRLINNSGIGIKASIVTGENGHKALKLTSEAVGSRTGSPVQFNITEQNDNLTSGIVETLGLNKVSNYPANAVLTINDEQIISESNSFIVDNSYEINLKGTSAEFGEAHVGVAKNTDPIKEELGKFADYYNKLLDLSKSTNSFELQRLNRQITGLTSRYVSTLEQNGLSVSEDYKLEVNDDFFADNTDEVKAYGALDNIKNFKNDLLSRVKSISLDPMQFIDKKIVAYKNPNKLVAAPYASSVYAGLMFNGTI